MYNLIYIWAKERRRKKRKRKTDFQDCCLYGGSIIPQVITWSECVLENGTCYSWRPSIYLTCLCMLSRGRRHRVSTGKRSWVLDFKFTSCDTTGMPLHSFISTSGVISTILSFSINSQIFFGAPALGSWDQWLLSVPAVGFGNVSKPGNDVG